MTVKYGIDEYDYPCLVVLGCFDGIHIGHKELLSKAKLQAKINGLDLGVMLFADGKGGQMLYPLEERMRMLEDFNVKFVLLIDYTEEFKATTARQFLDELERTLNVKAYMSGKDFRFGAGAKGKSSTLKNYAEDEENGVWYTAVKDVTYGDEKVSSTLIKKLLEEGDIKKANILLGREYSVSGEVISGAGRGSELGFPTVNIRYPADRAAVKEGVYSVECLIGDRRLCGIANYGARPTFEDSDVLLETYIEDFGGDLYGQTVTVYFKDYLRETRKFDSAEDLASQLSQDIAAAKNTEVKVD